jgi:hypothetical protein
MSEMLRAVEAPRIANTSMGVSPSEEIEYRMTCTSLRMSLGKSGRSGRSVSRAMRMADSGGRPSRRKKDPGIRPPAYMRSS